MDPVSAAANFAAIIALTVQISEAVVTYSKAVKNAPKDVESLIQELQTLHSTLQRLSAYASSKEGHDTPLGESSALQLALTSCEDQLRRLLHQLDGFSKKDGLSRTFERLKWPFSEKEVQKTIQIIRRHTSTFSFSLTVDGWFLLSQAADTALQSLEIQQKTSIQVLEMTKNISSFSAIANEAAKISTQFEQMLALIQHVHQSTWPLQTLTAGVTLLAYKAQESEKKDILAWLSPYPYDERHHDIRARRLDGTGGWLLDSDAFKNWAFGSDHTLCCLGSPGVGKSVLTSLAIDHLQGMAKSKNSAIAYFYFDYRGKASQTPEIFVASLLHQLSRQTAPFPKALIDLYDEHKHQRVSSLMPQLLDVLSDVFNSFTSCFILIDAIDECIERRFRMEILDILSRLGSNALKLFLTSRPPAEDLKPLLQTALKLEIFADESDLRRYCSSMIRTSETTQDLMRPGLEGEIIETVLSKAERMFLLPMLQMQAITQAITRAEIRKILNNVTSDLGQAFQNTIQRINEQPKNRREVALNSLMWTSYARRPLHISELTHALATRVGDDFFDEDHLLQQRSILESCFGLIVIDEESSTVRLVHYALQEYLRSSEEYLRDFEERETQITEILLTYLCFDRDKDTAQQETIRSNSNEESRVLPLDQSFLEYATRYWGHHARDATFVKVEQLAIRFLTNPNLVERATRAQISSSRRTKMTERLERDNPELRQSRQSPYELTGRDHGMRRKTGLHLAAGFGLSRLVETLLTIGVDINAADENADTPLHLAVSRRHSHTISVLLAKNAKVNAKDLNHNSPLYLAVMHSDQEVITTLLDAGADPDAVCVDSWTPLHKAADNGHVGIVDLLLGHGVSIEKASARGLRALHRAAGRGHTHVMELLLKAGTPVDLETHDGWTPLHGASSAGQVDAVEMLLRHGADINAVSKDGQTPLHRASRDGRSRVVKTLLRHGANRLVEDRWRSIPIHRAAKGGYEDTITALLGHQDSTAPIQLAATNKRFRTARDEAIVAGHWDLAIKMQQQEARVTGKSPQHPSDLEKAVVENDSAQLEVLIGLDPTQVNVSNEYGLNPLHVALLLDRSDIAERLLQLSETDVAASTAQGWQALHCAAKSGNEKLVQLCLNRGSDVTAQTATGETPLHKACISSSSSSSSSKNDGEKAIAIIQLLLTHGADLEAQDETHWRPIHVAAASGCKDVVKFLVVDNKVDLWARNKSYATAQGCAARRGHHSVVEFLRNLGYQGFASTNTITTAADGSGGSVAREG